MRRRGNSKEIIRKPLNRDMTSIRNKVARMKVPTSDMTLSVEDTSLGQEPNELNPDNFGLKMRSTQKIQIPEPPKAKELVVPKIDKGPLFINRNKFFEAESLVQEMGGVSQTFQDELLKSEETLHQDRNTISQLDQLISAIDEKITSLKNIVSP